MVQDEIWAQLAAHRRATQARPLRSLFAEDATRFTQFSARLDPSPPKRSGCF